MNPVLNLILVTPPSLPRNPLLREMPRRRKRKSSITRSPPANKLIPPIQFDFNRLADFQSTNRRPDAPLAFQRPICDSGTGRLLEELG